MTRLQQMVVYALSLSVLILAGSTISPASQDASALNSPSSVKPNFLFVVFEDMGPRIGAFGDAVATTPVLDAFAAQSAQFANTFTTAGVCAPSRSSLITGVHQQTLGTQHMRTRSPSSLLSSGGPISYDAVPPADVKAFPELLRKAGYYTSNNGKTDYQFGEPFTVWDDQAAEHPWRGRPDDKPFFAMVNIMESHESFIWPTDAFSMSPLVNIVRLRNLWALSGKEKVTDPESVEVPPYLPDTPVVRADIARHYDNIAFAEKQLARLLDDLEADGLADNTIVVVTTDHGDGFPRMKRAIYDSGIKVPMMVRFPDRRDAGVKHDRLVSFVDLGPTFLSLPGEDVPDYVQGQPLFSQSPAPPRDYIVAGSDRFDGTPEYQRAIRDERWKYIRNYRPDLPFFRHLNFRDQLPTMKEIWRLHEEGSLTPIQAQYFATPRPEEELYDTAIDPHEIQNLAADPAHGDTLTRLRAAYDAFVASTGDLSSIPEAEMIEAMWPDMQQPETAPVEFSVNGDSLSLTSATQGASIGYQRGESTAWQLYAGPIKITSGSSITAKAIRYGYAESTPTHYTRPQ